MGSAVDPTGLSFTVTKKDGTTASVSPQTHTPTTWGDTAGTQTCTFTYTDGYDSVSCDVEADVQAVTLESLEITGSLSNTQYLTDAPDLTGLTVKAVYSNGDKDTLDSSVLDVSPAHYTFTPTSGASLPTTQDITISYTDGEVTATSGVQNVEVHGKDEYTLPLNAAGSVYYDGETIENASNDVIGAGDLFQSSDTFTAGQWCWFSMDSDSWNNDTLVDGQKFMGYVPVYGVDLNNWAVYSSQAGDTIDVRYSCIAITGEGNGSPDTCYTFLAPIAEGKSISAATGYRKSDFDLTATGAHIYLTNFT